MTRYYYNELLEWGLPPDTTCVPITAPWRDHILADPQPRFDLWDVDLIDSIKNIVVYNDCLIPDGMTYIWI